MLLDPRLFSSRGLKAAAPFSPPESWGGLGAAVFSGGAACGRSRVLGSGVCADCLAPVMLRPSALHQHTQHPGRGLQCTQNIQMMQWERATRSLREDGCPSGEGTGHARFIGCFPVPFLKQVKQRGENDICLGFFTAKTINKCVLLSSSHSCHLRLCFPCCLLLPCQSIYIL